MKCLMVYKAAGNATMLVAGCVPISAPARAVFDPSIALNRATTASTRRRPRQTPVFVIRMADS
jgi:hypothetical protein